MLLTFLPTKTRETLRKTLHTTVYMGFNTHSLVLRHQFIVTFTYFNTPSRFVARSTVNMPNIEVFVTDSMWLLYCWFLYVIAFRACKRPVCGPQRSCDPILSPNIFLLRIDLRNWNVMTPLQLAICQQYTNHEHSASTDCSFWPNVQLRSQTIVDLYIKKLNVNLSTTRTRCYQISVESSAQDHGFFVHRTCITNCYSS